MPAKPQPTSAPAATTTTAQSATGTGAAALPVADSKTKAVSKKTSPRLEATAVAGVSNTHRRSSSTLSDIFTDLKNAVRKSSAIADDHFAQAAADIKIDIVDFELFVEGLKHELQEALEYEQKKVDADNKSNSKNDKTREHEDLRDFFAKKIIEIKEVKTFGDLQKLFTVPEALLKTDSNPVKQFNGLGIAFIARYPQVDPEAPLANLNANITRHSVPTSLNMRSDLDPHVQIALSLNGETEQQKKESIVERKRHVIFAQIEKLINKDTKDYVKNDAYKQFKKESLVSYVQTALTTRKKVSCFQQVAKVYAKKIRAEYSGTAHDQFARSKRFVGLVNKTEIAEVNADFEWLFFVRSVVLHLLDFYKNSGRNKFYHGILFVMLNILKSPELQARIKIFEEYNVWFERQSKWKAEHARVMELGGDTKKINREKPLNFNFQGENEHIFERSRRFKNIIINRIDLSLLDAEIGRGSFKEDAKDLIIYLAFLLAQPGNLINNQKVCYIEEECKSFSEVDLVLFESAIEKFINSNNLEIMLRLERHFSVCQKFFDEVDAFQNASPLGSAPAVNPCSEKFGRLVDKLEKGMQVKHWEMLQQSKSKLPELWKKFDTKDLPQKIKRLREMESKQSSEIGLVARRSSMPADYKSAASTPVAASAASQIFKFGTPVAASSNTAVAISAVTKPPLIKLDSVPPPPPAVDGDDETPDSSPPPPPPAAPRPSSR